MPYEILACFETWSRGTCNSCCEDHVNTDLIEAYLATPFFSTAQVENPRHFDPHHVPIWGGGSGEARAHSFGGWEARVHLFQLEGATPVRLVSGAVAEGDLQIAT
jgi:hypothetical protein